MDVFSLLEKIKMSNIREREIDLELLLGLPAKVRVKEYTAEYGKYRSRIFEGIQDNETSYGVEGDYNPLTALIIVAKSKIFGKPERIVVREVNGKRFLNATWIVKEVNKPYISVKLDINVVGELKYEDVEKLAGEILWTKRKK